MLQPIPPTNVRLNSDGRRKVRFSKEGIKASQSHALTTIAIAMSKRQAKRKTSILPARTPSPKRIDVIGSSCAWGETELDRFQVEVRRDIDPKEMIPDRFFSFDCLEEYRNCIT
jgi:hypothetical protein